MTRQWNQVFSRLALAATLALVFMPSLSRLVQAVAAQQPQPAQPHGHAGMHDMAGMHHDMAGMHGMHQPPAQEGHGGPAMPAEGDCDYCPILASLSLPDIHVLAVPALAWPPHWDHAGSLGQPGRIAVTGLGARGPPMPG